ncbi:MAG: hypothetical protein WB586_12315, partial [Chthoniobacterales bacterium]
MLIELPDEVLLQIKKGKTNSEVEAYRVALEAIRALHFGSVRGDMTFVSHDTPNSVEKKTPNNLETHNKTKVAWPNICVHS